MREKTPIIFIHGFPLDSEMWEEQEVYFQNMYDVHCLDLPGFGKSKLESPLKIEDFAKYISLYLKEKGIEKAVICGFSMGGYITFAFYEMFPECVNALIFADTRAKDDSQQVKSNRNEAIEMAETNGTDYFVESMLPKLLFEESFKNEKIVSKVKKIISRQEKESVINALKAMRDRKDRSRILKDIEVPSLFICGEKDILTTPQEMKEMSQLVKNSEFVVVERSGHLSNIENPEKFNTAVYNFLKRAGGGK